MKKFKVIAIRTDTEIYLVEAESKEQAMNLVHDGKAGHPFDFIEGDVEVYYPDIQELRPE